MSPYVQLSSALLGDSLGSRCGSESPFKLLLLLLVLEHLKFCVCLLRRCPFPQASGSSEIKPLLLLLLSRFSRVQLCATPEMAAYQALLSLGFSRQEHWSGLPFPSPMHESENESEVAQSCPTSRSHGLQPTRLLHPWDFPSKNTGVGCHCLLWKLSLTDLQS